MAKKLRTLDDAKISNKTVLVRANLDVPIKDGVVQDDTRIKASIPTLEYLQKRNCKVVILAHLGRPEGKYVDELSLMPVRFELGRLLQKQIKFANIAQCENSIKFMEFGDVLLLENLRFAPEEESKNPKTRKEFIRGISKMADLYINDCFGLYRKHASVYELPQMLPSYAGLSMQHEIEMLSQVRDNYKSPYVGIIGGAKLDTKIDMIYKLIDKFDKLLLGGSVAYTFLKVKGKKVGKSIVENDMVDTVKKILKKAEKKKCEIILPVDHICGESFAENAKLVKIDDVNIPANMIGLDIGPKTIELYENNLKDAQTILWNGPMGVFEWKDFAQGTSEIGEFIALSTSKDCIKIAGGGDTTSAINILKIKAKRFNHISVGGGMMLQFLSGEEFEVLDLLYGKQKLVE